MESQGINNGSDPGPGLRFTVLRHDRTEDTHWDLLLEVPGREGLLTFQIPTPPEAWLAAAHLRAVLLPEHRRLYLDYQGPLTDHRGQVTRYDTGRLTLTQLSPTRLQARLQGARLRASLRAQAHPAHWTLHFAPLNPSPP